MPSLRRRHVNMVEAGGARRDKLRAAIRKPFQHIGSTTSLTNTLTAGNPAARKTSRARARIEADKIMPVSNIRLVKQRAFVTLGTEYRNPHVSTPGSTIPRGGPLHVFAAIPEPKSKTVRTIPEMGHRCRARRRTGLQSLRAMAEAARRQSWWRKRSSGEGPRVLTGFKCSSCWSG